jgi:hypothetical protein
MAADWSDPATLKDAVTTVSTLTKLIGQLRKMGRRGEHPSPPDLLVVAQQVGVLSEHVLKLAEQMTAYIESQVKYMESYTEALAKGITEQQRRLTALENGVRRLARGKPKRKRPR